MTVSPLPQRVPRSMDPTVPDDGVRRFIAARNTHAHLEFRSALERVTGIVELSEVQLIIDDQPEDDILDLAYTLERARKTLRFWRHATAPSGSAYDRLQLAREHALGVLTAPDDPTHREGQHLERSAARSFYNQTTDEYVSWWIEHGEALELEVAP